MRKCLECKQIKPIKWFYKGTRIGDGVFSKCATCKQKERKRSAYHYKKKLAKKLTPKKTKNQYMKERKQKDPLFKLLVNLRNRNYFIFSGLNKSSTTIDLLGCSIEHAKNHLEKQFKPGMSWQNYGKEWQVDHIIPLRSAKNKESLERLCHFSNLQPLFKEEHKIKTKEDMKLIKSITYVNKDVNNPIF